MLNGCGSLNFSSEILVRSIAFTDRIKLYFKPKCDSQIGIEGHTQRPGAMEFRRLKLPIALEEIRRDREPFQIIISVDDFDP